MPCAEGRDTIRKLVPGTQFHRMSAVCPGSFRVGIGIGAQSLKDSVPISTPMVGRALPVRSRIRLRPDEQASAASESYQRSPDDLPLEHGTESVAQGPVFPLPYPLSVVENVELSRVFERLAVMPRFLSR
jgi:hypothetical protein